MKKEYSGIIYSAALLLLGFMLSACGGSSGTATPSTTVSGVVFAGPASGTAVTIKTASGTIVAGPVTTATDGSYTVAIPDIALSGDLIFEASGGTFPDEATTTDLKYPNIVTLGTLSAHVAAGTLAAGTNVTIDPASTIVQKLIASGKPKTEAFSSYSSTFGYKPNLRIKPAFANLSCAATTQQRLAGLRVAAFSQLTKNLGIQAGKQFDLINNLASDLADGTIDGGYSVDGKIISPDIANRFSEALLTFQQSANNQSKLTTTMIGAPSFIKVAYTDTYKVEYVPGSMAAATGKTMFKIKLTNRSDNSPAIGKTVTVRPYMYMATKSHTTPMEAVVPDGDGTTGTYSCTVYYVMSSVMNSVSMGVWELKVTVNDTESIKFFPVVSMPMGSTKLAKLLGVDDAIMGTAGLEKRTWFLFNDGLTGTSGNYTFKLFLATKESGTTLTFPAVKVNDLLNNEAGVPWSVNTIAIEASTDKTSWVPATDAGNGHWSATGLTGLAGKIYVRLTVNGEQKTTDSLALAADGANGYQTFTVTPM